LPPGAYESPLDKLSNSVVDAIEAGDYDAAEKRCQQLLREYPGVFDGHERMAMLRDAQGRFREAAEHYTKLLKMMKKNPRDLDPEMIGYFTKQRDQALAKARERR
jgi:tetratricopeptide (TPR) repeat protein